MSRVPFDGVCRYGYASIACMMFAMAVVFPLPFLWTRRDAPGEPCFPGASLPLIRLPPFQFGLHSREAPGFSRSERTKATAMHPSTRMFANTTVEP